MDEFFDPSKERFTGNRATINVILFRLGLKEIDNSQLLSISASSEYENYLKRPPISSSF